jgi:hypothetical protein
LSKEDAEKYALAMFQIKGVTSKGFFNNPMLGSFVSVELFMILFSLWLHTLCRYNKKDSESECLFLAKESQSILVGHRCFRDANESFLVGHHCFRDANESFLISELTDSGQVLGQFNVDFNQQLCKKSLLHDGAHGHC